MALLLSDSFFPEARHLQRRRRMTDFFDDFFSNLDFLPPMHKKRRLRDLTDQKAASPSETSQKDGGFSLDLDIHGFAPEQLQVSVDGNSLVIEGTHSSKSESGSIRRNFVQKVKIPKGVDVNSIKSSLGSKGRLYITGEAKKPAAVEGNKRKIPIAAISENEK
ncbi:hypothetical protein L596_006799 [Steinernema carpocapsae]|uniref:SHSP domain-containing protein n=1 Tax=Steinernema carpocapsae TaxID=34508 RepID=A0A4U5P807_STECR|nr:hypothetical protein L596_006799 [Steinernema carpocapsae]